MTATATFIMTGRLNAFLLMSGNVLSMCTRYTSRVDSGSRKGRRDSGALVNGGGGPEVEGVDRTTVVLLLLFAAFLAGLAILLASLYRGIDGANQCCRFFVILSFCLKKKKYKVRDFLSSTANT